MFKNAVVKRFEWAEASESWSAVVVVWQDDSVWRVVSASAAAEHAHDRDFEEAVFASAEEAFAWVEKNVWFFQ